MCLNVFGFPQLNEFLEEKIELMEMSVLWTLLGDRGSGDFICARKEA